MLSVRGVIRAQDSLLPEQPAARRAASRLNLSRGRSPAPSRTAPNAAAWSYTHSRLTPSACATVCSSTSPPGCASESPRAARRRSATRSATRSASASRSTGAFTEVRRPTGPPDERPRSDRSSFATLSQSGRFVGQCDRRPAAVSDPSRRQCARGRANTAVIATTTGPVTVGLPAASHAACTRCSASRVAAGVYVRPVRVWRCRPLPTTAPRTTSSAVTPTTDLRIGDQKPRRKPKLHGRSWGGCNALQTRRSLAVLVAHEPRRHHELLHREELSPSAPGDAVHRCAAFERTPSRRVAGGGERLPKCRTTYLADKHPTRCTLTNDPIGSGTASQPPGIRLAERGWRQIVANPVALAHHLLNSF